MSKDMLGSVVRAAVGVPQEHQETLAKLASKLSVESPKSRPLGRVWHNYLKKILEQPLPQSAYLLDVLPTIIDLGEFVVNYDETVEEKLRKCSEHPLMHSPGFFRTMQSLSVSKFRSAEKKGPVRYKASVVSFSVPLEERAIDEWARQNKKLLGGLKEGIDVVLSTPILKLASALPFIMFGECRLDHFEFANVPSARPDSDKILLEWEKYERGNSPSLWDKSWKFLTLQEVPLEK